MEDIEKQFITSYLSILAKEGKKDKEKKETKTKMNLLKNAP